MDAKFLRNVLLRCFLYGMVLLTAWFLMIVFAGDWAFCIHSKIMGVSRYHFNKMNYLGMMNLKMTLFTFFLIPAIAITVTMKEK